jgi:hypothetical protein
VRGNERGGRTTTGQRPSWVLRESTVIPCRRLIKPNMAKAR